MKKSWMIASIVLCLAAGLGLYLYALSLPIYTDMNGPLALTAELSDAESEGRTKKWYEELAKIETSHKRYADLGRGLIGLAAGLGLAWRLMWKYGQRSSELKQGFLMLAWSCLWLLRVPLVMSYYILRQGRHDYPGWADSIGIPIMSEWIMLVVGWLVTLGFLRVLQIGHKLPVRLGWMAPAGWWGHVRFGLAGIWLAGLALIVFMGVVDGNEGLVIACTGAIPLLAAVMCAKPVMRSENVRETEMATSASA